MTYLQQIQSIEGFSLTTRATVGMLVAACTKAGGGRAGGAATAMAVVIMLDMDEMTPDEKGVLAAVTLAIHEVTGEILKEIGINLDPGAMA